MKLQPFYVGTYFCCVFWSHSYHSYLLGHQAIILATPLIVSLFFLFPALPSMLGVADYLSFYFLHSVV